MKIVYHLERTKCGSIRTTICWRLYWEI